ncbi:MAG: acyl-CoA dehydrogenase [Planctomycetota bacterium]|nr:acyl-CoA dehydrogenase [Planctomycetota bacterium]MDG1983688.1 acyl-CoA dehydrogenase [Planctomycetota bacterium]
MSDAPSNTPGEGRDATAQPGELEALRARADEIGRAVEAELAAASPELGEIEAYRVGHRHLQAANLLQLVVPASAGGADVGDLAPPSTVSVRALVACRQALAYRHAMADLAFVEQGLGSFPIALGSADAGLLERLSGVARGEEIPALALTESGAGSDLSGVATRAERDGDDYVLTGSKTYITNVGVADFYTVLARTSGEPGERDGLTMFFVEHGAHGLSTRGFQVMAPHPIGELFLEGVRVPAAHVLGEVGAGMDLALANLARFRITVAAAANGFARRALAESVAHLSRREQFGRPLSSFQGLRFDLAEMDTRLRAAELLTDEAAAAVDAGEEATAEVARAKLFSTENASWVCDRAVQHHGGAGVRVGSVVERLYRDTRALRIYEGTSEVQKLVLAKHVLRHTPAPGHGGRA